MIEKLQKRATLYFGGGPEDQRAFSILSRAGIPVRFIGTLFLDGRQPELEIHSRIIRGVKNIRKIVRLTK